MAPSNLLRLSGLAAVGAGVLLAVSELLGLTIDYDNLRVEVTTGFWFVSSLGFMLGAILLLGALIGIYLRQAEAAGTLGLLGFLVAFVGTALVVGATWADGFFTPGLAEVAPEVLGTEELPALLNFGFTLSFGLASLGWLLLGVATLRARVYPRAAAILLIVGAVLTFIPLPLTSIVLSVAVAWLGLVLMSGQEASSIQATTGAQPRVQ